VQNHGGIGFTREHTAHRYVTRSRLLAAVAGGLRRHQADLLAAPIA
jgi:alkylation response protein AidB-like acyl-CoA dehydrogenase